VPELTKGQWRIDTESETETETEEMEMGTERENQAGGVEETWMRRRGRRTKLEPGRSRKGKQTPGM
jgi:hypothetical protein